MPFGEHGYRSKSQEELSQQLESAQATLGSEAENTLVPESQDKEDILNMSEAQLKEKFGLRYEMYLKLLRDQKRVEHGQESTLSEEEISEIKKWLKALNSLDKYMAKHHEGEEVTLRGKQIDVFQSLHNFVEEGGKEGYVKLPTGVGKTVLFTEMVEAMDLRTLIIVPTKILVDQTGKKIEQFAPDLDYGKIYTHAKEHGRQVTITTYRSLVSQLKKGKIKPEDFDCLILDEAHEALGEQSQAAVNKFEGALKLGFTATPDYSQNKKLSNLLEKEIHAITIREAIESGMLSGVSSVVVRTKVDMSSVSTDYKGEYKEKELAKAVNVAGRNQAAIELYKQAHNGELAVVYCVGIEHARVVADKFQEEGLASGYITGEMSKTEQKEILEKFHNGEIKILCNSDLLIAGFDEPRASVCINLRPTRSRIDAEQRGGRALRLDEGNPNKHATVIDFLDEKYNEDNPPVIFADIADGVTILPPGDDGTGGGGRKGKKPKDYINIEGVEVVFEDEEVMKIVRKNREVDGENKKAEKITNYSLLKIAVQAAVRAKEVEVDTSNLANTYGELLKLHPNWPGKSHLRQIDGFVSIYDLFDIKMIRDYTSLKIAVQAAVRAKEVEVDVRNLGKTYDSLLKIHNGWIKFPQDSKGFVSLEDLFDIKIIRDYAALKAAVRSAVETDKIEVDPRSIKKTYSELQKLNPNWPKSPDKIAGFISLADLFGAGKMDYAALKAAVRSAVEAGEVVIDKKRLQKSYADLREKHPLWVFSAHKVDGFVSLEDLFGIEEVKK